MSTETFLDVSLKEVGAQEWTESLDSLKASNLLFQSVNWHNVLFKSYGFEVIRHVAVDADDKILGALASCKIVLPHEVKYISLPFSDYAGPVSSSPDVTRSILNLFSEEIDSAPFVIRCCGSEFSSVEDTLCVPSLIREGFIHRIDLSQTEEVLWNNLSGAFRRAIRKAEKFNLQISFDQSPEAFQRFWKIHSQIRRQKFIEIPQPRLFFDILWEEFSSYGKGGVVEAWHHGECVAAILYLIVGDCVYYKFSASLLTDLEMRPNNLVLWLSILEFRKRGFLCYDLGLTGASSEYSGLRRYKLGTGASEIPLRFWSFNSNKNYSQSQIWKTWLNTITTTIASSPDIGDDALDSLSRVIYPWLT